MFLRQTYVIEDRFMLWKVNMCYKRQVCMCDNKGMYGHWSRQGQISIHGAVRLKILYELMQIWSSIEYMGQYGHCDVFPSIPGRSWMLLHLRMWLVGNLVLFMRNIGMDVQRDFTLM